MEIKRQKLLSRQDEIDRVDIEGRFGHSKRRYGLDRIMAKLADTSACVISLVFLVMNLERILRDLFLRLICSAVYLKHCCRLLDVSFVRWFERIMLCEQWGIMEMVKPIF